MKKLINSFQKALYITAVIAFVFVIGQCGSLDLDLITPKQYVIRCVIGLAYIGIVALVSKVLGSVNDN